MQEPVLKGRSRGFCPFCSLESSHESCRRATPRGGNDAGVRVAGGGSPRASQRWPTGVGEPTSCGSPCGSETRRLFIPVPGARQQREEPCPRPA